MKNKPTQKDRVIKRLLATGEISRNACLHNFISRLSAIIQDLEVEGFEFEAKNKDNDYVYKMTKCPYKLVTRTLGNGEVITTLQK